MANTERLAALAKVRAARNAIQDALERAILGSPEKASLSELVFDLNELEDSLILGDISENVDSIRADGTALSATVAAMQAAADHLVKELSLVDDAAKAVGALADVVSLAASHGLLG